MLIDAFTFNGEMDMLEFRLRMLWSLVDKFIIVESNKTFSGNKKELNFLHERRFDWAEEKIKYYPHRMSAVGLDFSIKPEKYDTNHACWKLEEQQRNAILDACHGFEDESIIMLGDVDEIPTREALKYALDNEVWKNDPVVFRQSMFYYNLKFLRKEMWHGTIITNMKKLREVSPQILRDRRNSLPNAIENGGWHLSHFGGIEKIINKIESYSHQENNRDAVKNPNHVAHCIETGEDLYDRDVPIMAVRREQFPEYFREHALEGWW